MSQASQLFTLSCCRGLVARRPAACSAWESHHLQLLGREWFGFDGGRFLLRGKNVFYGWTQVSIEGLWGSLLRVYLLDLPGMYATVSWPIATGLQFLCCFKRINPSWQTQLDHKKESEAPRILYMAWSFSTDLGLVSSIYMLNWLDIGNWKLEFESMLLTHQRAFWWGCWFGIVWPASWHERRVARSQETCAVIGFRL